VSQSPAADGRRETAPSAAQPRRAYGQPQGSNGSNGSAADSPAAERRREHRWADPAIAAAAARTMDGMSFFGEILAGRLPPPPIATTLGFDLVSVDEGRVVFELTPAEFHYNPIGSVHGGVYATLCDSACGCAVHSMLPAGAFYTSLDLATRFIRPVTTATGRLRCEGTVSHLGSRTAVAHARLTDAAGKLYAEATSSCMIFRPGP
jgi:uncharacterized protein (TIGR00369 family)